mgnify:FL=1
MRIRAYLIFSGIFLFFTGIFYIVHFSPVFKIRNFNILGKEHLTKDRIVGILEPLTLTSRMKIFLGRNNILSWNVRIPDTSKTALLEANVRRDWIRQSVDISVKERVRVAIWCGSSGNCGWIDDRGMIFDHAPQAEGSLILTIFGTEPGNMIVCSKISEDRFIGNIVKIIENLGNIGLAIKKINFDPKLQEIRVQNYSGPDILFSIRFDPEANISSLKSLIGKGRAENYKYIDLRVENRIYYKTF